MDNYKPSKPEDAGKWRYTLPGNAPVESTIFWDDRGFAAIYIDGRRQLPVHMLDEAKWERIPLHNARAMTPATENENGK
jgi:hypothetical protein